MILTMPPEEYLIIAGSDQLTQAHVCGIESNTDDAALVTIAEEFQAGSAKCFAWLAIPELVRYFQQLREAVLKDGLGARCERCGGEGVVWVDAADAHGEHITTESACPKCTDC